MSMEKARIISRALNARKFKTFFVGGCVRDHVMGRVPHDIDMTTDALPFQMKLAFETEGFTFVTIGEEFGTIAVIIDGEQFEITTFRTESGFSDGRHPDNVTFVATLEEDLGRRDLTINAIAMDTETMEIIDPFGGISDIKNKIIRFVGKAEDRIDEDKLRMMRACRFVGKFGFLFDWETFCAIKAKASLISEVSAERIKDEWMKMFSGEFADMGIHALIDTGLLAIIEPESARLVDVPQPSKWHKWNVLEHEIRAMMCIPASKPLKRFAVFRHDIGKVHCRDSEPHFPHHADKGAEIFQAVADRLKLSNEERKFCSFIIGEHMRQFHGQLEHKKGVRKWLASINGNDPTELFEVWNADNIGTGITERFAEEDERLKRVIACVTEVMAEKPAITIKDLAIGGRDLLDIGIPASPRMGEIQKELLKRVIDSPELNNRETLLAIARSL